MPVFRLTKDAIITLQVTTYADHGIQERADLQRLLKSNISVVAPDVLVISEEFGEWEDSKRRIDLLGIDCDAKLVVIEFKRDDEGGHMELQAIRYAAMVSRMTFSRAVKTYQAYLDKSGRTQDARADILRFLQTSEPLTDDAVLDVRIVLVSEDFAKELTTAVLWLNEWELDIRCVRVKPYNDGDGIILEVQQIVPLPEAEEYVVTIRTGATDKRFARVGNPTGYWFMNTGDGSNDTRSWEDCKKYGFMLAGGGKKWIEDARKLKVGDKLFAYLSRHGYVGLGIVTAEAVPMKDFVPAGQSKPILELPLVAKEVNRKRMEDPDRTDWCAGVNWIRAVDREIAVLKSRRRLSTLEQIKTPELVAELLKEFGVSAGEV